MLRTFVSANLALSRAVDACLPRRLREDGNKHFAAHAMPQVISTGGTLYDLGGGSRPCVSPEDKRRLKLRVIGLDISAEELAAAPNGVYDQAIAADLCTFRGDGDGDVVICQATLEHVPDTRGAIAAIASCLKPGGRAALFAPCRNAVFARLNLALPEGVKKKLLFSLFPHKAQGHDGFKAYYDRCTPREIAAMAEENGLVVEQYRTFWTSTYFTVFAPAFLIWRVWQGLAYVVAREQAAEAFWFVLKRPEAAPA